MLNANDLNELALASPHELVEMETKDEENGSGMLNTMGSGNQFSTLNKVMTTCGTNTESTMYDSVR